MCEYPVGEESSLTLIYVVFRLLQLSLSNTDGNLILVLIPKI